MKKLLICTQSVDPNDPIAGFFSAWVREFARHCDTVTVVALSGVGAETLPSNVTVVSLGKEKPWNKFQQLIAFYKAIFKFRTEYDTVFVHNVGPKFVLLGVVPWRLMRKHIALWYVHGSVDWKLRLAEKVIDYAFSSAPETFRVPSKKVTFLGHGIDVDALGALPLALNPDCFTILQAGRVAPRKHADVLLKALPLFEKKYNKPYRVIFVGATVTEEDKTYLASLQKEVDSLGLQDKVSFLGGVPPQELRTHYTHADVTVNVSSTSGVDKTALESLAVGVPVLTTFSVFNKILGPLASSYVLPELHEGTPVELAEALYGIAQHGTDDTRRNALKECARAYASLPVLIERILALLYDKKGSSSH
jgi:glycosyltransferase involved in cell wall biosynthesis